MLRVLDDGLLGGSIVARRARGAEGRRSAGKGTEEQRCGGAKSRSQVRTFKRSDVRKFRYKATNAGNGRGMRGGSPQANLRTSGPSKSQTPQMIQGLAALSFSPQHLCSSAVAFRPAGQKNRGRLPPVSGPVRGSHPGGGCPPIAHNEWPARNSRADRSRTTDMGPGIELECRLRAPVVGPGRFLIAGQVGMEFRRLPSSQKPLTRASCTGVEGGTANRQPVVWRGELSVVSRSRTRTRARSRGTCLPRRPQWSDSAVAGVERPILTSAYL